MSEILTLQSARLMVTERSFRLKPLSITSSGLFRQAPSPYGPVEQRWIAELTYPPLDEADWRYWDGFIANLGGMTGRFRAHDPARRQPRYNATVKTTTENWDDNQPWDDGAGWESGKLPPYVAVAEAASRGETDLLLEFPDAGHASLSAVLRSGDLFEVRPNGVPVDHGHLYVVTGTANTDANGQTRVYFRPGLRASVADGDMVVLSDPTTVFQLSSDAVGDMVVTGSSGDRATLGLSLIEVLPEA